MFHGTETTSHVVSHMIFLIKRETKLKINQQLLQKLDFLKLKINTSKKNLNFVFPSLHIGFVFFRNDNHIFLIM